MKKAMVHASLILGLAVILSVCAGAQEPDVPSKIEVGIQFSSLTPISQSPQGRGGPSVADSPRTEAGFGGRFTFNLTKHLAFEAEGNFFPRQNSLDFFNRGRLLQGQFGIKAGKRFGRFGIFGKARPGFASFSKVRTEVGIATVIDPDGQPFTIPIFGPKRQTYFSMDLGGVLEFYPSRKMLTRIDVGDTVIPHSTSPFSSLFPFGVQQDQWLRSHKPATTFNSVRVSASGWARSSRKKQPPILTTKRNRDSKWLLSFRH